MSLLSRFAPRHMAQTIASSTRRFPLTIAFVTLLTIAAIYLTHFGNKKIGGDMAFFIIYWPATAAVLSLSLALWAEELKPGSKVLQVLVQAVVHMAWLGGAVYTSFGPFTPMRIGAAIAANTAIIISTALVPFWRERNDLAAWNFTLRLTIDVAVSWLISTMLAGAVTLLIMSFQMLFGVDFSDKIFIDIWIICELLIAPLMLMQIVPGGESKHDRTPTLLSGFGKGVVNYLLLPVTGAYALTLYAYTIKIVVQWQLPNGWVSYLVTAFAALMLIVVTALYPTVLTGNCSRLHKAASRWLPVMVLPMLLLMTVGVARRIGDYGITINRLYLAVLNAWLYVVCIGLIVKSKRIWWIPASFAALLIITSIGPQSVSNVTRVTIKDKVTETIKHADVSSMPLDRKQYTALLQRMQPAQAALLDSRLDYLLGYYSRTETDGIIHSDVQPGNYSSDIATVEQFTKNLYACDLLDTASELPQGYRYVTLATNITATISNDKAVLTTHGRDGKQVRFAITYTQLQHVCSDTGYKLTLKSQNALLMVNDISYYAYSQSISIGGLLLEK